MNKWRGGALAKRSLPCVRGERRHHLQSWKKQRMGVLRSVLGDASPATQKKGKGEKLFVKWQRRGTPGPGSCWPGGNCAGGAYDKLSLIGVRDFAESEDVRFKDTKGGLISIWQKSLARRGGGMRWVEGNYEGKKISEIEYLWGGEKERVLLVNLIWGKKKRKVIKTSLPLETGGRILLQIPGGGL